MITIEELQHRFSTAEVKRVKFGTFDIDGVLRGKHVSLDKFWATLENGLGFCDVIFGWDIDDALLDNVALTGWHTGYPDAQAAIDPDTFRMIPWEPGTAFFLLDLFDKKNQPLDMAPRQVFRRVLEQAEELDYEASFAAEFEFWCFRETPHSLREKNFRGLTPLSPGNCGYSVLRASENSSFVLDLFDQLALFEIPIEGLHTETGPGVYEAAIQFDQGLAAADKAALFKTAVKEVASRHGIVPTFMAKWNASLPGSSGHLHQSLWREGENQFYEGETLRHYVGGLVRYLPELMCMICPTVNSYKRTVPGTWAPVNSTWGEDSRTTAVRVISGSKKSSRVELRLAGADIHPHIAMAAALAAGLEGVTQKIDPPAAVANAYEADGAKLPRNLADAVTAFHGSALARRWFGDAFVDHYSATRAWEVRQYEKAVTDWELSRYFEAI